MKRFVCASVALVTGCATASKDITPAYVSPLQYQSYNCEQLAAEGMRIQTRVTQLGGRLDQAASNDKAITGVGVVLFWPALFFLGGTKQQEAEYSRLSGEYQAVQQEAVLKKCPGLVASPQQTAQPTPQPQTQPAAQPIVQPVSGQALQQPTAQPVSATVAKPGSQPATPAQ